MMNKLLCVVAMVALVAVVSGKPEPGKLHRKELSHRVQAQFERYLSTTKRNSYIPDIWMHEICMDADCCANNDKCKHGSTCENKPSENADVMNGYGFICTGSMCGTSDGQYAGVFCDVLAEKACDGCRSRNSAFDPIDLCYPSEATPSGAVCMKNIDGQYIVLDKKEIDGTYGKGASHALERIAKEEATKYKLINLLERYLDEE